MSKSTLAGIILIIIFLSTITGVIFSKIQIDPVFMTGISGTDAFNQNIVYQPMSLFDLIVSQVVKFFDSINPFRIKLF